MPDFLPPLVMSVHGIRTHAEWQNTLAEVLNRHGIQFKHCRFGYYPLTSFFRSGKNREQVDAFFNWYDDVIEKFTPSIDLSTPMKRPSVIAHSLGSFIVGYAMLKYPEIKFDKVILCGSILPTDFDWHTLFVRYQVGRVRNECGGNDVWVSLAPFAVRGTGRSGRDGFGFIGSKIRNEPYEYQRHSDFFQPGHIKDTWLPFLRAAPSALTVVHGGDIRLASDFEQYIHRSRAIDRVRFGAAPVHDAVTIPYGYSRQWRAVNPDIYTFLMDRLTRKVCGYLNAMPLEKDVFEDVLAGRILDNQIPGESVVPYVGNERLNLYLMSIAVAPRSARAGEGLYSEPVEALADAFLGRLRVYAQTRNIRVDEIAAIGWTAEGRRMCERLFGMKRRGNVRFTSRSSTGTQASVEHPVYRLQLSKRALTKPALLHRGLRKLVEAYDEMDRNS